MDEADRQRLEATLRERAGQITPADQKRVDQALDVSLGLTSF